MGQQGVWMGHSPLHNPHRNPQGAEDYRGELYKLLGVTQTDTTASITKAYYKLARQHHPDKKKAHDDDATFKQIKQAHEVLTDNERRELYDRTGFMCVEDMQAGVGREPGHR